MISKIALRILRKLDLPTSAPVRTPFDFEYFFCSMDNYEKRRATPFKVQNAQRLNKTELMASKISSIFTGVGSNPIKQMLLPAEEDTE